MRNPECKACELNATCKTVCMSSRGASKPRVLFVGGAPSLTDDAEGRGFTGSMGRLLSEAIRQAGITDYALTFAVRCCPPNDKGPKVAQLRACQQYLDAELEEWKPEIVVPIGATALRAVTGKAKISEWAGVLFEDPRGFKVFPLNNPEAALHPGGERVLQKFVADFTTLAGVISGSHTPPTYARLTTEEAMSWINSVIISDYSEYTIDLETSDLNPRFGQIRTVALCCAGEAVWFVWDTALVPFMRNLLRSGKTMVAHNAVFEVKWLLHHLFTPAEGAAWSVDDTLLLHYLLDENSGHDLKTLARAHTDIGGYENALEVLKTQGQEFHEIDVATLGNYNAGDADACYRLYRLFYPQVWADRGLRKAYNTVLRPAIWSVALAELAGRKVCPDAVSNVAASLIEQEQAALVAMTGDPRVAEFVERNKETLPGGVFNPGSSKQLGDFLFRHLKLPKLGVTDTGQPSVAEKYLRPLESKSPFVAAYLSWKEAKTLRNNYLGVTLPDEEADTKGIMRYVRSDGFLYGSYLLHGTTTGRLASASPNLQNFAPALRKVVVSRFPRGRILEADFSQLELRLIAWASGCKRLLEAYRQGRDVHRETAVEVLKRGFNTIKTVDELTDEERKFYGKIPNFGLAYGAGPDRFHREFGTTLDQAETIHSVWHDLYPEVGAYIRGEQARASATGTLRSFFGRIRRLPEAQYTGDDPILSKARIHARLAASNFKIQSLGSDLNTLCFGKIAETIREQDIEAFGIGLTHDSGTYDVALDAVPLVAHLCRQYMVEWVGTTFPEIAVPMDIDIKVGKSWGSLKSWKPEAVEV